ncbi:MAG TPA: ankyrin repeat domain-containing protein [Bryobacteraceae bacterium]|nr:ankyrin repeat domain-containing protein [Bryobacteraceae bacterium]
MRIHAIGLCLVFIAQLSLAAADSRLADAAMAHDRDGVKALIAQKADVNGTQPDGTTALHWAVRDDNAETVELLIRAGASVKAANRFGQTPIALAAMNGNAAIIGQLLAAGEDANKVVSESGDTVLMVAARTGKPDAVAVLLDRGADVNKTNATGQTALMWAASEKNAGAVEVLIRHKADLNAKTHAAPPPKPLDTIFSAPFPVGGMTALLFAARQNDMKSAALLLTAGANINETAQDGTSPILVAVLNGHYTLANFLLVKGADPNLADGKGRAALYAAVDMRNLEWSTRPAPPEKDPTTELDLIDALIAHGANLNARLTKKIPLRGQPSFDGRWANMIGATPFWRAAQSDDVAVMKLLKEKGADVNLATSDHTTPLMVAAGVGWSDGQSHGSQAEAPEALRLCMEWGGDINAKNDVGYTALHGAAFRGANEVVKLLVEKGARMDVKNQEGRLPVNMAEGMHIGPGGWVEHEDTAALLRKLMAAGNPSAAR